MTAEAPKPTHTLTTFLARTAAGRALLTQEREHAFDERAALVEQLADLDATATAEAERHNAEIARLTKPIVALNAELQAALGARHAARTEFQNATHQRDRKRNAILRKLATNVDERLQEMITLCGRQVLPLVGESFEDQQTRAEAVIEARKRLDAMTLEAIPPAELDRRLEEIKASIPKFEATFSEQK